jgi:hypothetical protein
VRRAASGARTIVNMPPRGGPTKPPAGKGSLRATLEALSTPAPDYADGDAVSRQELDALIWNALVALPCHPFFVAHAHTLGVALSTAILKWQASDRAEREGLADARSFVWRASYYDVVLVVLNLCYGPTVAQSKAHLVMGLYGEKLDDYLKEFDHA